MLEVIKGLDQGQEAARRTRATGIGKIPPYSALFAFMDWCRLLFVDGSHATERNDYQVGDSVPCDLPRSWAIAWHGLSVHAGDAIPKGLSWLARYHIYLNMMGMPPAGKTTFTIAEKGVSQGLKRCKKGREKKGGERSQAGGSTGKGTC